MNLKQNSYKPISFWSWNGLMEENEIRCQIKDFKQKGFGGFFIHSRAGRMISYLGNEWMIACGYAIDEAKNNGLDVWLYDEDGWPSGFAGGIVNGKGYEYWAKTLVFEKNPVIKANEKILCAFVKTDDGYSRIDVNSNIADFYCIEKSIPTYVDLMNPIVTKEFIKSTHEKYKKYFGDYFGNTIKGIFTDEPQLVGEFPWSNLLSERYISEYKEDLLDKIWCLCDENHSEIKYRYRKLTNELLMESFVMPINDWCNANSLYFTGHFPNEDGLVEQSVSTGGVMSLYNEMNMPGIDYLGNRYTSVNLMKQVTSVAHRKSIPYVLSESFGCSGWNVSFKNLMSIIGWQEVFGVNTFCTHLSSYTITGRRKRDYPAFFSYHEPWWSEFNIVSSAMQNLSKILNTGNRLTNVAVLNPIRSCWSLTYESSKHISSEFRNLQNNLMDLHIDYDLIDETELSNSKIVSNTIVSGAVEYSLLIVPPTYTLASSTIKFLEDFSKHKGRICFIGERPKTVEGRNNDSLISVIKELPALNLQNSRNILQKAFRCYPIEQPYNLFDDTMKNEVSGLACRYVQSQDSSYLYCFNYHKGARITAILRHINNCEIHSVNIYNLNETPLKSDFDGESTFTKISVEPDCGLLLKIKNNSELQSESSALISKRMLDISEVTTTDLNCLTLDMGYISIAESEFGSRCNIVNSVDGIYDAISKNEDISKVQIKYYFYTDFTEIPSDLYMAFESNQYVSAQINGNDLKESNGWFVDKGIFKYDISKYVFNGENQIILTYLIPSTGKVNDLNNKFESERNRFFYNIEPENIYILGNFDVKCQGDISSNPNFISVSTDKSDATFILKDSQAKNVSELTKQNLWFYRGDAEYETYVNYNSDGKYYLTVEGLNAVLANIYIGDNRVGDIISEMDVIELTEFLKEGDNTIKIVLKGSNRNLFGPHHHMMGEPPFVGPNTFIGVAGFEDFVTPEITEGSVTYTDNYSFVPFGIKSVFLTIEKN